MNTHSTTTDHPYGKKPALSVLGITKRQADRAIKWLCDRNYLAFYRPQDKSLNAFEYPQGSAWTYDLLERAIKATR